MLVKNWAPRVSLAAFLKLIIHPISWGYGNRNSCSSVKLWTDVAAVKAALVLRNFQWDLSSRVLPLTWDKRGTQTWLVIQAQLMCRNSVTIRPVPIALGTALSHFSHNLIRVNISRERQLFTLEEGSQYQQRSVCGGNNFSIVLVTNWVFRFLRSLQSFTIDQAQVFP